MTTPDQQPPFDLSTIEVSDLSYRARRLLPGGRGTSGGHGADALSVDASPA